MPEVVEQVGKVGHDPYRPTITMEIERDISHAMWEATPQGEVCSLLDVWAFEKSRRRLRRW